LPGTHVIVAGGGKVGCEVADFIAQPAGRWQAGANQVTIMEMAPALAQEEKSSARRLLIHRLLDKGVRVITSAKITEILADGVRYVEEEQEKTLRGIDSIVMALGTEPHEKLSRKLKRLN